MGEIAKPGPLPVKLWINGLIYTSDEHNPQADALVFDEQGVILAVGTSAALRTAWPGAETRDLEGAVVIPGLIDSHGHLHNLALSKTRAQLRGTRDIDDIVRILKEHEKNLSDGDWLLGRGWDQNDWPHKEFPDKTDLDRHFPDRPVLLDRVDGHAIWVNSAALSLVDRDLSGSWQPQGGFIHRDASGQASGILLNQAEQIVEDLVPPETEALMSRALDLALQQMVSLGLTGTHEPGVPRKVIERYLKKINENRFPSRVYVMVGGVGPTFEWLCAQGGIAHSDRLWVRSVKLYADGALGSRGAALLNEYSDEPGNRGLLFHEDGALRAQVAAVMACGFQVAIHAIGDAANRQALDAIIAVSGQYPDNPGRHRIEHAQVLTDGNLEKFAPLGIIAAVQPTHATSDMYWAEQRLGPDRVQFAYAWRKLVEHGARLALGSDFVVEEVNPMLGFYAAVARSDPEGWPEGGWHPGQRLSRAEALRGFTLDAAYAAFMEDRVGSLAPGKLADMVILDRDIMQVDEDQLPSTLVLETWLGGRRVYHRGAR
ncbi:MAG: amidohydrolase [Gammaproteobacteria bacterium]|nr:amidohydrolase [Gammaproteobacteria bacterium]